MNVHDIVDDAIEVASGASKEQFRLINEGELLNMTDECLIEGEWKRQAWPGILFINAPSHSIFVFRRMLK